MISIRSATNSGCDKDEKEGVLCGTPSFFDACGLGLLVELLLTQALDVDGLLSAFPVDDGRFSEFLTLAKFFHDTSFLEFSLELLECSFNVFTSKV